MSDIFKDLENATTCNLFSCPHGQAYCPYHDHDDELCIDCLEIVISFYKKHLKALKNGSSR